MKKLVFVLLLLVPMVAVADRRNDFVNKMFKELPARESRQFLGTLLAAEMVQPAGQSKIS